MDSPSGSGPEGAWRLDLLARPLPLALALVAVGISAYATSIVSCNVHEISHAVVGTVVGWEVDRVALCPGGAEVTYIRTTGTWYGRAEGFAGGYGAAAFILATYWLVIVRGRRPLRAPAWWAAGLGMLVITGPQLVIGTAEGVAGVRGWNYTEAFEANLVFWLAVVGLSILVFGAIHLWRWRALWRAPPR